MATLRDIKHRISGVKKTQQITKAMKMVAAAKLRRAQQRILSARPYAYELSDMLRHLVGKVDVRLNPLLKPREIKKVGIVIVTADRGLCGGFNSNLIRAGVNHIHSSYDKYYQIGGLKLVCIGKKGFDYFNKRDYLIERKYTGLFQSLQFVDAQRIVKELTEDYLTGVYDKIDIVYNEFKTVVQPRIAIEQFLPIPPKEIEEESKTRSFVDYIYEPSVAEIVDELIPKHLDIHLWRVLLESNAAEEGARMVAMDNATENAKEMIQLLQLTYNKARQAAITKELLEIVGGANALESAR